MAYAPLIVLDTIVYGPLLPQPDGTVTAQYDASGTVLSVQPDGAIQSRPPGTAGAYERAVRSGTLLLYRPVGTTVYALIYVEEVPNP